MGRKPIGVIYYILYMLYIVLNQEITGFNNFHQKLDHIEMQNEKVKTGMPMFKNYSFYIPQLKINYRRNQKL